MNVLLVGPDESALETLQAGLSASHDGVLQLEGVGELSQALARLDKGGIDAVLLKLDLPDSQGAATFERAHAFAPEVPIVVVAGGGDEADALSSMQAGAQDYVVESEVSPSLLVRAVRHAVERHRLFVALRRLALIDELTGLYNRRGFAELGEQHLRLARRAGRSVALVYLDVDRFKTINDSLGHHVGDRALLRVADILRATFRRSDILARVGGDEFVVLGLEAADASADLLVERLRERVHEFNDNRSEPYSLSLSIGMVQLAADARVQLGDLVGAADEAMFREKNAKRPSALRNNP